MSFVTETNRRDRMWSAGGAALIVALLGYGLVSGLTVSPYTRIEQPLPPIHLTTPPPPPKPKEEVKVVHRITEKAKGKPSPPNLRNKATPIVAPPPPMIPVKPPVIVAPRPDVGMAPQTGASDRAGPGQGAGGEGNGHGGGGEGEGGDTAPKPIRDLLKISWLPPEVRQMVGETMQIVYVRYSVETDGRIGTCQVTRSSGNRDLDSATCAAIQQHFKYRPARDPDGQPFRAYVVTSEGWQMDRGDQ